MAIVTMAFSETKVVDVTNDGYDDKINVNEYSVTFIDGLSGRIIKVYSTMDTEYEINRISECSIIHLGNKNGLKIKIYSYGKGAAHGNFWDLVFLWIDNKFVEIPIQAEFAGEITETELLHPKLGKIFVALSRLGMIESYLYWDGKKLRDLNERDAKFCNQMEIFLNKFREKAREMGYEYTTDAQILEALTQIYESINASVKLNMHTIQICVENYCIQYESYPRSVSEFKHLLAPTLVNPVNSEVPVVIDGKFGQPGQVTYSYDPKTDVYVIYGFDANGIRLDFFLSNK